MRHLLIIFLLMNISQIKGQHLQQVEPPNWWVGMKSPKLQIMVHGQNIATYEVNVSDPKIQFLGIEKTENPNYLFVNLDLSKVQAAQNFDLEFSKKGSKKLTYSYALKNRISDSGNRKGFGSSDAIYLITPDRFANGNPTNDVVQGLRENKINRNDDYARHGGDIKGITDHLEYIESMGFTAIWPCPLLINDMPGQSYHGYAMTDFYQVDPRFGTLEEYIEMSTAAKSKGIKLIMDQVVNHIGREHWWMKDLPGKDWVNFQNEFLSDSLVVTNHRRTVNQDPYASKKDRDLMADGWFVPSMPDLNQQNPLLAKYLIQNSIWWIETLDLGGIRQDTYPYPDKNFMSDWAGAIMQEYPNFSIVGEEWSYNPLLVGYWQTGAKHKDGYESNLTSTMDFPMQKNIIDALNEEESWGTGFVKMYEGLANDFYDPNPEGIMAFLDNHDMDRVFTQLKEDKTNTQMALAYLLAMPRIVQIYYGTEILMENSKKPGDHGLIRTDFPGGWKGDQKNGFTGEGMSADQLEMQNFLKKLLNYRKNSQAIHQGKTIHFAPKNGVYLLARILNDEVVVVILNKNEKSIALDLDEFEELGLNGKTLENVVTGDQIKWNKKLTPDRKGVLFLSTKQNN